MTTYPRNGSASVGKLLLNTPKIPRPHNLARNSPTPLSNFEIETLIFRGFQGVIQETRWGITCEIWGGLSGTRGVGPGREAASAQQLFLTTLTILTILTIRHVYP